MISGNEAQLLMPLKQLSAKPCPTWRLKLELEFVSLSNVSRQRASLSAAVAQEAHRDMWVFCHGYRHSHAQKELLMSFLVDAFIQRAFTVTIIVCDSTEPL